MKTVILEQRSAAWRTWRRGGVGGSEIAAIMGESPYRTRADILRSKVSGEEQADNPAMRRGRDIEPEAMAAYEAQTGETLAPACGEHDEHSFLRASFDGITFDGSLIVEIKVPSRQVYDDALRGIVPRYYWWQVQHQLLVSGAETAHFACFISASEPIAIVEVRPDEKAHERIITEARDFMRAVGQPSSIVAPEESAQAKQLTRDAISTAEDAASLVPTDQQSYELAAQMVVAINARRKALDAEQSALLDPVRETEKRIRGFFRPTLDRLADAETKLKAAMTAYRAEQDRKRRDEHAVLMAAAEEQARARIAAAKANLEKSTEAVESAQTAEERAVAERAQARAALEARTAEVVRPMVPAPSTSAPVAPGVGSRKTWCAEVLDLRALLIAAIDRDDLMVLISVDQKALDAMARGMKDALNVPGVRAVMKESTVVRKSA